jgi:hypothetical protein
MKETTHMQKWFLCSAVTLAVAVLTGCESTSETTAANPPPAATAAPAPAAAAAAVAPAAPAATAFQPVRIKAGASEPVKDSQGITWLADQGFTDGELYEAADAEVANTKDPALYRTERYSMTAFSWPVPNDKYTVKLHFAEVYSGITGPGDRVFSFDVQGHEFKDFDIWTKAGGFGKAYVESVDVDVTTGKLNITFTPKVENPKICAIEILPRS